MHDGGAAVRRASDRSEIQEIVAVNAVIADDIMPEELQVSRYRGTHVTAIPRDQNAHNSMIGRGPAATPTDLLTIRAGVRNECRLAPYTVAGESG
jgi:hypothetical protein